MAALVQTISQPISTVTMLQTRPGSASGTFSNQNPQRGGSSLSRGGNNLGQYRPNTAGGYPLTSIPGNNQNPLRQHPPSNTRLDNRSMSAPGGVLPTMPTSNPSTPSPKMDQPDTYFKNDSNRLSLLSSPLDLSLTDPRLIGTNNSKPSPDRYKRAHKRSETTSGVVGTQSSAAPSGSGMASVGHLYNIPSQSLSQPSNIGLSKDDISVPKTSEAASRYRRRSIVTYGDNEVPIGQQSQQFQSLQQTQQAAPQVQQAQQSQPQRSWASVVSTPYTPAKPEMPASKTGLRPSSSNGRQSSSESVNSIKREPTYHPTVNQAILTPSKDFKIVNIPPRGSSDAAKRLNNPSPLSNPVPMGQEAGQTTQSSFAKLVSTKSPEPQPQSSPSKSSIVDSPAQQQLQSLSKKDVKKDGKPSRLRRAFSFGSAAELRKASAENSHAATSRKLQKPQYETEEEAREAAIVQRQEASGLGNSIYSGQGNIFSGSTDNLSVSSTASSASVMLRKMGKGMKKGTRSLVGLFRPKSVVGVPPADGPVQDFSTAQVSMVTVEAEREKVNVNVNAADHVGGGTGFPKLERNSLDTGGSEPSLTTSDRSSDGVKSRRSIVGSEKDRAEVLAAVKKGILKRAGTESGSGSPAIKSTEGVQMQLPQLRGFDNHSPHSSAPGTPDSTTPRGHRRTDSVTIEGEDYFISMGRFTGSESKSLPGTPKSSARNISFSPRLQFHDTWTANDYDRRGEIATCNRLTPSLAQAIKEELNTFKMEMEVHESSKVYTHFF